MNKDVELANAAKTEDSVNITEETETVNHDWESPNDREILAKEAEAAAQKEPVVETPKVEKPIETDEDEIENEDEPTSKPNSYRINIKDRSPEDQLAIELIKKNRNLPMAQALEMAKQELGLVEVESKHETRVIEDTFSKEIQEQEAKISEARAKKKQAAKDYDMEAVDEATDAIDEAKTRILELKLEAREAKQNQESKAYQDFSRKEFEAQEKAKELYPEILDKDSALNKEIKAVYKQFKELDDPIINSPAWKLKVAQIAANRVGLVPVNLRVKAPATKQPTQNNNSIKPSAGGTRTTQTSVTASDSIKSMADYRALMKSLKIPTG